MVVLSAGMGRLGGTCNREVLKKKEYKGKKNPPVRKI